jgi:alkylation response protein AidB-like acyl-CoA dehydrogenase
VARQVADWVREATLGLPLPPDAPTLATWRELASLGREDLAVARLVEGHVDARWILAEAGRRPRPGAAYGVWASASGGTGLRARTQDDGGWLVDGTMRYCSGAWFLDRALVVIATADGHRLIDLDVRAAQTAGSLTRQDDTWPAVGMDATQSVDVVVRGLRVDPGDAIGGAGFYLERPGFAAGGVGVAAVWLGGAAGVLDALVRTVGVSVSAHQRAHLGAMAVSLASADALLAEVAEQLDELDPATRVLPGGWDDAVAARTAVELAVDDVLRRAPRVSGATPLCRDATFAHRLADLGVYVRQHHAEADHEYLGGRLLANGTTLGRSFG